MDRHFALIEALKMEKNPERQEKICLEDIALVADFNREWINTAEKEASILGLKGTARKNHMALPRSYPAFKKLAVIYEKAGKYDEAIEVCKKAIAAGYKQDGTEGGMTARVKKLKEKKAKTK